MYTRIARLRIVYWAGAVVDAVMVVPLLVPPVAASMFGIEAFDPAVAYRYVGMIAASLMAGWTGLLVWGAVRPVERRGVLLLTAVPVIAGLIAAGAYAVTGAFITAGHMWPTWLLQTILLAAYFWAYMTARALATAAEPASRPETVRQEGGASS